MNPKVIFAVGGAVGLCIGFGAGVLCTKSHFEKIAQRDAEELREYIRMREKELDEAYESITESVNTTVEAIGQSTESFENLAQAFTDYSGIVKKAGYSDGKPDLSQLLNGGYTQAEVASRIFEEEQFPPEGDDEDTEYDPDADLNTYYTRKPPEERSETPYLISYEEFSGSTAGHDNSTLMYYAGDDTLTEMNDELVNIADTVGDCLEEFARRSTDVIYVRNERIGMDYEVIFSVSSFKHEVMGMGLEDDNPARDLRGGRPNWS